MFYVSGRLRSIWNIQATTPRKKKTHYDNDKFEKKIPAMQHVDFEHCRFRMEIDDDGINEIEEFEKHNGNRISRSVCGIHTGIKKNVKIV